MQSTVKYVQVFLIKYFTKGLWWNAISKMYRWSRSLRTNNSKTYKAKKPFHSQRIYFFNSNVAHKNIWFIVVPHFSWQQNQYDILHHLENTTLNTDCTLKSPCIDKSIWKHVTQVSMGTSSTKWSVTKVDISCELKL